VENAMMVDEAQRWPLIIDPQSQAVKWVRNTARRAQRTLISTRLTDKMFVRNLETALQFGHTLLVENLGERNICAYAYTLTGSK
jgi:dynein heavy chain